MTEQIKISDLIPDDRNANAGTERGDAALDKSLSTYGAGRSILIDRNDRIIAGNKTAAKFGELGLEDVIVVETDGSKLVAVRRTDLDLDSPEARGLAIADNRVAELNLEWEPEVLQALNEDGAIDLDDWFHPDELDELLDGCKAEQEDEGADDEVEPTPNDLFSSSNEWGVPDLDPDMQPSDLALDWLKWGAQARTAQHSGGIHFYADDYKFSAIWDKPDDLISTGCKVAIEPNFSTWTEMPRALAIADIYRKRWLARYWQENGVEIAVDVNVCHGLQGLNFLGVPKSWRFFATRYLAGYDDGELTGIDAITADWQNICAYTESEDCTLLVYGGGPSIFEGAPKQWIWIPEHNDKVRGRGGQK